MCFGIYLANIKSKHINKKAFYKLQKNITMEKIATLSKKSFNAHEIKEQFSKLEEAANAFSQQISKLKKEQDDFNKYMKQKNLFH
jgi:hypothetical protein